jgi:plastocyanin
MVGWVIGLSLAASDGCVDRVRTHGYGGDDVAEDGMTPSRVVWSIVVPFCLALAIIAVVVIVRENTSSASADGPAAAVADEAPTVVMEKIAFTPSTLTIPRGAEVLFDNKDVAPHTVTADEGDQDSGIIDPGSAYRLTVNEPFEYHCSIHPSMTAKVELEG